MGILPAAAVDELPEDWSGVMQQDLYTWVPTCPEGYHHDVDLSVIINIFASSKSAKTYRSLVRSEFEQTGAALVPEEEHGARGLFHYRLATTMPSNPDIPQNNFLGVFISEGTNVVSLQLATLGENPSSTDGTALLHSFTNLCKDLLSRGYDQPLSSSLLVPANQPGFNLVTPTVDGRYLGYWGATDQDLAISHALAGNSLYGASAVHQVTGPNGSSYYLRDQVRCFNGEQLADSYFASWHDLVAQSDAASGSPPQRLWEQDTLTFGDLTVNLGIRYDDVEANAFIFFPGDESTHYPGVEIALLQGDRVFTYALYGPDPNTFDSVKNWNESEEFQRLLEEFRRSSNSADWKSGPLGFPTFEPTDLEFSG